MKNPREILARRHAHAEPKLDAIRAAVVGHWAPTGQRSPTGWQKAWQELVAAPRLAWYGLGGAWALILALQFSSLAIRPKSQPEDAYSAQDLREAVRQQRGLLPGSAQGLSRENRLKPNRSLPASGQWWTETTIPLAHYVPRQPPTVSHQHLNGLELAFS